MYRDSSDSPPAATGWASEREGDGDINTVACLENTETSAVGRALANLGFTASTKRPSREEMEKAARVRNSLAFRDLRRKANPGHESPANAAADVLELLSKAEQQGFPPRRATTLRDRIAGQPGVAPIRMRKIEMTVRSWIRRREL
ncbi:MAG: hypothetical protein ACJ8AJ_03110 [Gemmatimonadaceae bacterium]